MFWKKDGIGNCCMVVIQSGTKIYALVIKSGTPVARNEFEPGVEPREVMRWGKRNRAQSVKWLLPSDIYDVRAEIPADADFEERALAFNYELAALSGQSSDSIRPSVWIEDERRGGRRDRYCSGIAVDFIYELADACRRERVKFGGVGGLQQAVLAYYAGMGDGEACGERSLLMFMRDNAFLAGASGGSLSFRNIPFGLPGRNMPELQWKQRVERRLGVLSGQHICLCMEEEPEHIAALLTETLSPSAVEILSLRDIVGELGSVVAGGDIDAKNNFCLASPPPKVKDPREAGTKLCLFMIGATLAAVSFQYAQLRAVDAGLTQNFERKSNLSKTLASLESQVSSQQQQLERYKYLCELAGVRSSVEDKFLTIIDLLSRYRLKYTKINSVEQQIEGIIISGETHWQPDLSQFLSHFEGELARRGMGLFSEGLKIEDEGGLEFKCRISRTPVPR